MFEIAVDWLFNIFAENIEREAVIWNEQSFPYDWLLNKTAQWQQTLNDYGIKAGEIVALEGDHSPFSCSLLIALINNNNIIIPLSTTLTAEDKIEFMNLASVRYYLNIDHNDSLKVEDRSYQKPNTLIQDLINISKPGLVLFSSGSTGKSKGAVHDFNKLLKKYMQKGKSLRCLVFLLFDHIGGINTIFSILSSGGTMIIQKDRSPAALCSAIEKHRVELLPTTPTFLNLLILSEDYRDYNLSSLRLITYGTEPMPEYTLKKAAEIFPEANFKQTYGLSEVGIVGTKSESNTSLWVKLGGNGYDFKIKDDILWIKAESSMLGYLNAPSPFDEDGWFNTQDLVMKNGDFIKILGRETEIINVGGQKVYPAEVENVILAMDNIKDVSVQGVKNPIMGNVVCARVNLIEPEDLKQLKDRVYLFCREKLEDYKVPVKIEITEDSLVSTRFKKIRR